MDWSVVILAAGKGTRMKSALPKVLHPVAGKPMLHYVVDVARDAGLPKPTVVVGNPGEQVREAVGGEASFVEQDPPLGTGHALLQARRAAADTEGVLVLSGDAPLITADTIRTLTKTHEASGAALTLLSAEVEHPEGLGRVCRDADGNITGILEESEAEEPLLGLQEVNAGAYCFQARWLWPRLEHLEPKRNGEYYLTDLVAEAARSSEGVAAVVAPDASEVLGINTRVDLARAEAVARERIRQRLMLAGVTIVDPPSTFIDATVRVEAETTVHPHSHLRGHTTIAAGCEIGPGSIIQNSRIGARSRITLSVIEGSVLEEEVVVGPFSHVRPGSHLETGVRLGNYAEVKNSHVGRGTQMGHFSYLGDADVGRGVNVGAGAITCNFDGTAKHRTSIGDGAFIGSDTMLVAPVRLGAGSGTGAGAVVTKDVPDGMLAVGAPARAIRRATHRSGSPATAEQADENEPSGESGGARPRN